MSNPLICGNCGTPNRANAKFCIGCAGRLPGLAPAGGIPARMPAMQALERDRPIAASRPEASSTSFWLHLGLVGLTMILAFVAWCIYVFLGRPAPWIPPAPATRAQEPVHVSVPVPTPVPGPAAPPVREAALTADRTPAAPRSAPTRTAAIPRTRRDTRDLDRSMPIEYPVVAPRPASQPDPGPPIVPGPGPQYSWTRPSTTRVAGDPGPPIAVGPGPRYEARPEVRAPVTAVMPSGDPGPPIAIGPGPRYDYSTPSARER
ncbi:zinc ribbon domain-containing protein [Variovorax ureilyticus]|uniref:zinc ribbon domain-containing protein n=1 Tax=Variovorax ureilyticus TaxID=1836198 RepID=UPI003D67CB72